MKNEQSMEQAIIEAATKNLVETFKDKADGHDGFVRTDRDRLEGILIAAKAIGLDAKAIRRAAKEAAKRELGLA